MAKWKHFRGSSFNTIDFYDIADHCSAFGKKELGMIVSLDAKEIPNSIVDKFVKETFLEKYPERILIKQFKNQMEFLAIMIFGRFLVLMKIVRFYDDYPEDSPLFVFFPAISRDF